MNRTFAAVLVAAVLISVVVFAAFELPGLGHFFAPRHTSPGSNATINETAQTVTYTSSVDGAALSFSEWLPPHYDPAASYPFLLFLHGSRATGTQILAAGGVSAANAALSNGFIVASLNTRTSTGFYVNSPFSGPQEQDVLDAIAHAKLIHHVSAVWLFGFSMGTIGSYSLAEHHPGLVQGIGVVASCPDVFETTAFLVSTGQTGPLDAYLTTTGGSLPGQSSYATAQTYYVSAFRFNPQNLSSIRLYVVQGGYDGTCPNNAAVWPWQEANDTILTSSCNVARSLGEPVGCTTPFEALAAAHPGQYHSRFIYEPKGVHSIDDLYGPDMISYFLGGEPDGLYWAPVGGVPYPAPA